MPTAKIKESFICDICGTSYENIRDAVSCEEGHSTILISLTRTDLSKLLAFLNTGEPGYLSESLVSTLKKYDKLRGA